MAVIKGLGSTLTNKRDMPELDPLKRSAIPVHSAPNRAYDSTPRHHILVSIWDAAEGEWIEEYRRFVPVYESAEDVLREYLPAGAEVERREEMGCEYIYAEFDGEDCVCRMRAEVGVRDKFAGTVTSLPALLMRQRAAREEFKRLKAADAGERWLIRHGLPCGS